MTYYRHYIVVEPNTARADVVISVDAPSAARLFGKTHKLGGTWVAVQHLAGVASERLATWSRWDLAGPDCDPTEAK